VASGPSTDLVDLRLINGLRCIAVSHGCRAVPDADLLLFGGHSFVRNGAWRPFNGSLIVQGNPPMAGMALDGRMVHMRRAGAFGLTEDPTKLAGSESSVMLAINYAVHRGVSRIILLGCDGKPGPSGERRIGSPETDTRDALRRYVDQERAMRSQIKPLADLGVSIVNCSPESALGCYPRADLEDAIAAL
jgi:hypothetical protein